MITIIDYGAGNIKSIKNMLRRIGANSNISNDRHVIEEAEKLILPGVGHFSHGMQNLINTGLVEVLNKKVLKDKVPILGICLGAQLLGNGSQESEEKGLGWINMNVVHFEKAKLSNDQKIPHMGWNEIDFKKESMLTKDLPENSRFYFVHSYHMDVIDPKDALAFARYGYEFTAAIERDNIYGVQFHPEKSHKYGMQLLKNFTNI